MLCIPPTLASLFRTETHPTAGVRRNTLGLPQIANVRTYGFAFREVRCNPARFGAERRKHAAGPAFEGERNASDVLCRVVEHVGTIQAYVMLGCGGGKKWQDWVAQSSVHSHFLQHA